jgi:plastocyanin
MNVSVATKRPALGILNMLAIGGLLALVLDLIVWDVNIGGIIPAHLIFGIIYLVSAGLLVTGWRWMPVIVGVLTEFIALTFIKYSQGFVPFYLTHPYDKLAFALAFLQQMLSLLVLGAGLATLVPAQQRDWASMPQWLKSALSVLGGIVVGGLLISLLAAMPSATTTPAANGTTPVHATLARFVPDIVALHVGDKLTIIPDAGIQHNLLNGTWNGDHPMPGRETSAPVVNNVALSSNTITIGPFTTAGTYHIYCTIHPGMMLTVVVA